MLRSLWTRLLLRGTHFSDRYQQLNLLYKMPDPWGMTSEAEQYRFRETNRFIERHLGRLDRLLEIGCGEGHQTLVLGELAREVTGVDVSAEAIRRARERAPRAQFMAGDLSNLEAALSAARFDLVTACEVLYYMSDIPACLAAIERLGHAMLVTYFDSHKARLDPIILSRPGIIVERIVFGDLGWTVVLWHLKQTARDGSDPNRDPPC